MSIWQIASVTSALYCDIPPINNACLVNYDFVNSHSIFRNATYIIFFMTKINPLRLDYRLPKIVIHLPPAMTTEGTPSIMDTLICMADITLYSKFFCNLYSRYFKIQISLLAAIPPKHIFPLPKNTG